MYRLKITFLFVLIGGALGFAKLAAQNISSSHEADFDYVKFSNPRLMSPNSSGLYSLSTDKISIAELFFKKDDGKFVNYSESDNSYTYGARAESFYRLNSKLVLYGEVEYLSFEGKHMGGSVFLNPKETPFNIVEENSATAGKKNKERYHIVGAMSFDMNDRLTLGGKIDYQAANYAKTKDPRHKNKLLDMYLTVGANYKFTTALDIGANYYYRRSTEGMDFGIYGNTDREYNYIIDFGGFYGRKERELSSVGYVVTNNAVKSKPLFNEYHGVGLQLNYKLSSQISFYNEFTYKSRSGYYGDKSDAGVVLSEHESDIFEYRGVLSFKTDKVEHHISTKIGSEQLTNYENVYEEDSKPEEGSAGKTIYYDKAKVLYREEFAGGIDYSCYIDVKDKRPTWVLTAGAEYYNKKQTASPYPYYRKQDFHYTESHIGAKRSFFDNKNTYTVSLDMAYSFGDGTAKNDGTYATPSSSQAAPAESDDYLYREFEYYTSSKIKAKGGFKYSRTINPLVSGYVSADYELTKASDLKYISGDTFGSLMLRVGCAF